MNAVQRAVSRLPVLARRWILLKGMLMWTKKSDQTELISQLHLSEKKSITTGLANILGRVSIPVFVSESTVKNIANHVSSKRDIVASIPSYLRYGTDNIMATDCSRIINW